MWVSVTTRRRATALRVHQFSARESPFNNFVLQRDDADMCILTNGAGFLEVGTERMHALSVVQLQARVYWEKHSAFLLPSGFIPYIQGQLSLDGVFLFRS